MSQNKSISYQPLPNNRKPYQIKEHLSILAIKIKSRMDENQILIDTINNIGINIHKSKQQLKKFTAFQNKTSIENELIKNNTNLKNINKNLALQRKILFQKYIKLKNKYSNELEPLNIEYNKLSDRRFIMENILDKKDFEIKKYSNEFTDSLNLYIREEKREYISNNLDMDEDIIIIDLEKNQTILLNKLKEFNKIFNRSKDLMKIINLLKNIITKIKKDAINELSEEEKNMLYNNKNKNNKNFSDSRFIEEINSIEEDSILNETITSEYDDEENIEFIPISNNYYPLKLDKKFKIPKINLEQIEYNKRKFKQEDAEKSLSREIKDYNEDDLKIKDLKNKIKKAKNKNKKYQEKCAVFQKKIKLMEKIISNLQKNNNEFPLNTARNTNVYNHKNFSIKYIGNACGMPQNNSSVRSKSIKFGKKLLDSNNINIINSNVDISF
jgi:hypothetical protein